MRKAGLYANILAKQERIKAGSGEKMRKPGDPGAPTAKAFVESAKTAKDAKKDAKKSDLNFALLSGFTLRSLREILKLHKRKKNQSVEKNLITLLKDRNLC